ncbi:MAG: hypothetical protein ABJC19_05965 [Gemmatimonadota bacterium]
MKCRIYALQLLAAISACASPTQPESGAALLVNFDHDPTSADLAFLRSIGGVDVTCYPIADAASLSVVGATSMIENRAGVVEVLPLVSGVSTRVYVAVQVVENPTADDLEFVNGLSATDLQTVKKYFFARIPLLQVDKLAERERFLAAEILSDTHHPVE